MSTPKNKPKNPSHATAPKSVFYEALYGCAHTHAKGEQCPEAQPQHAPSPHTPASAVLFHRKKSLHPRTRPRPRPHPPEPGVSVSPQSERNGLRKRRSPDRQTSGHISHWLYRQHFSLVLKMKPTLPSPQADAYFKARSLTFFFLIA